MSGVGIPQIPVRYRYQFVPPSTVNVTLGINGAAGDFLNRLLLLVADPSTADVSLLDGATSIPILTGAAQLSRGPLSVDLNIISRSGPWRLTTGAGVSVIASGVTVG